MDATICKTTFEDPLATDLSAQSALILAAAEGVMVAASVAMKEAGFDFAKYEMSGAVLEALTNRASTKRWKDGKSSFPTVGDADKTGGIPL